VHATNPKTANPKITIKIPIGESRNDIKPSPS
jgi:hypothetical protein